MKIILWREIEYTIIKGTCVPTWLCTVMRKQIGPLSELLS